MEMVYVVERSDLFESFYPQGFTSLSNVLDELDTMACLHEGFFVQRSVAEHRPDWKQIIPYAVLRQGDKVWLMTRSKEGGEDRLHDMKYIGVGGHTNPYDEDYGNVPCWDRAMEREFNEEAEVWLEGVRLIDPDELHVRVLGFINDDSNAVGAVHFGLVYELQIPEGAVVVTEDKGAWVHIDDVDGLDEGEVENWTKLIISSICEEH